MDIIHHTVLAWLEEDNQRLGHFRVRPLMRETGPFTAAEVAEWRDDGFIRVVPDKSEQRSCKERMRALGSFCLLSLTGANADKFKPNKNYAPAKGEKNRYIVYSKAVQAVPETLLYEVVPESSLARAVTAQAYARLGGKIHGPVDRQTGRDLKAAGQLLPDDPRIFSVTLPDGSMRLFYWPQTQERADAPQAETAVEAADEAPAEAADAPEGMTALDQIKALDRQMLRLVQASEHPETAEKPQDVLIADDAGTPLYHAQVDTEVPQPRRNSLAQAVENTRRSAAKPEKKNEKKKAASKQEPEPSAGTEAPKARPFAEQLKEAWTQAESRERLADQMLALPGAREQFALQMGGTADPVLAALRAQLQDTEAERLMTVMNLNQAKAQEATYRDSLVAGLVRSERQELDQLRAEADQASAAVKALEAQQAELLRDQARLVRETGYPAVWPGEAAEDALVMTVARRVMESLRAVGFACEVNDAVSLLTLLALSGPAGFRLRAQSVPDSEEAARALALALGGTAAETRPDTRVLPGGQAALLLLRRAGDTPVVTSTACAAILIDDGWADREPLPRLTLRQSDALPGAPTSGPAVDFGRLTEKIRLERKPLNPESENVIQRLRALCAQQGIVLPLRLVRGLRDFAEIAQNLLEGGVSAALDRAVVMYALPWITGAGHAPDFLSALSALLPLTAAALA